MRRELIALVAAQSVLAGDRRDRLRHLQLAGINFWKVKIGVSIVVAIGVTGDHQAVPGRARKRSRLH